MTPQERLNILLADDPARCGAAAEFPFLPKNRILVFRTFHSGQTLWVSGFEKALARAKTQPGSLGSWGWSRFKSL